MKRPTRLILLLTFFSIAYSTGCAQMELSFNFSGITCDSVRIQSYNWNKSSGTNLTLPYQSTVVFKDKSSLKPGVYWITADSTQLYPIIISAEKKQKLTATVNESKIEFANSPENTLYQQYLSRVQQYNKDMTALDKEYQDAQKLPAYMLRTLADSLTARARRFKKDCDDYELRLINDNPGTLLASLIRARQEIPEIPFEYYSNDELVQKFVMEHYYDNFPWDDPRIFNTPDAESKFKNYTIFVYNNDNPAFDKYVIDALKASSVNATSHRLFFERLDKDLGYYMSNYKVEHTYIAMLKYILNTPKLEDFRRVFYEKELATINKNLVGSRVPNFNFVTDKGDTTNLYGVQSEFLILFLHNPNCNTCREVRRRIADYPKLNQAIASGRLNILTIYMEDDANLWQSYLRNEANPSYLHGWNYDKSIEDKELYETRTIPYMFLLNRDKEVIRKNLLYNEIEDYVDFLMQQ